MASLGAWAREASAVERRSRELETEILESKSILNLNLTREACSVVHSPARKELAAHQQAAGGLRKELCWRRHEAHSKRGEAAEPECGAKGSRGRQASMRGGAAWAMMGRRNEQATKPEGKP